MKKRKGILDWIEWIGNKLPDPTSLFLIGALLVVIASDIAVRTNWTVTKSLPEKNSNEATTNPNDFTVKWVQTDETFKAKSLLTSEGIYWAIKHLVENFIKFEPLGIVLVGMLGIGVCERTGMISALLRSFMLITPKMLLTPAVVFAGIMSSMTLDAGYVVLPPLAAALYKAAGRSPLAGLAATFAGVSAGFSANLFPTGLDPLLAKYTNIGAQVIHEGYEVNPLCNLYFMIASTIIMTLTGWAVTAWFVERRLNEKTPEEGGPVPPSEKEIKQQKLKPDETTALLLSCLSFAIVIGIIVAMVNLESWPLFGNDGPFDKWVEAIVPLLFFAFIIPGIVYGVSIKNIKSDKDLARLMIDSMAAMAPIIVLAFFAAQFVEFFSYSGLDKMLALWGGQHLGQMELGKGQLLVGFILVTLVFNLFVGSMSAKYTLFAPIFVPMFMLVGVSPELTQATYRIGDSVSNIITPLNPYLVIILVFIQKYIPKAGIGTLISTMLPYSIIFTIIWAILLLLWIALGIPLGPDGGLNYAI